MVHTNTLASLLDRVIGLMKLTENLISELFFGQACMSCRVTDGRPDMFRGSDVLRFTVGGSVCEISLFRCLICIIVPLARLSAWFSFFSLILAACLATSDVTA